MIRYSRLIIMCGVLFTLFMAFHIVQKTVQAACGGGDLSQACSSNYGLTGDLSAVESTTTNQSPSADQPFLYVAGGLAYADFLAIEAQARDLLERNMRFREDISPYRSTNNFNDLVRQFDAGSGFSAAYDDPSPAISEMTLQQRIDLADSDLRKARDLYAYLAVYAPASRMRADTNVPGADFKNTLCKNAENPNPSDPNHSGQVLDPVIDWCNFPARMRQAVREAAYLRMIFAQQFMVDALGLHFSAGALIGGDSFVRKEVAKLEAAKYQFSLAERGLNEAMGRPLGSGCYVSDFYSQSEWALFSRAVQGQEVAQHHIASRLSYLDINSVNDAEAAEDKAQDAFRNAATNGYIKLVGMSRLGVQPPGSGCFYGERPDGLLLAEMAVNMQDTRAKAQELHQGRNPFGFDITFTPARPYHTAVGSNDKGLWEQAKEAADLALQIQQQTENAERVFDLNQQDLTKAILATNNKVDNEIQIEVGCDLQAFNSDSEWYACIDEMIENTTSCDPTSNTFDACMERTTDGLAPKPDGSNWLILVSDMRTARQDLRVAWLGVEAAIKRRDNLLERANTETMRNTKVKSTLFTNALVNSAFEAIIVAGNCCPVTYGTENSVSVNYGAFLEARLRPAQIMAQAAFDMQIEDANSAAVVRNYFLDMAEAQGEIAIAVQQYNSMLTQFNGVVGQTGHDVYQSKREHAYTVALPANDPSYRMVRDSRRLELAQQLQTAARLAYLAARRAEYEYTARLSGNNFRISDIYKARTANDILIFLQGLDAAVSNLPGSVKDADTNQRDLTFSVAYHLLGLTDQYLRGQGVTDANLQSERQRRFQAWAAQHTSIGTDSKPVIVFTFTAPATTSGLIGQVVQQGYDYYWLHKVAGIGQPKPGNNGFGLNLVTTQTGSLGYRQVRVSQSGQVAMTSFAGCVFDYRLMPPAVMLGLDYPSNQPTDVVTGIFNGDVNGLHGNTTAGYSTPAFLGRPLASTSWQVVINAASPDGILPDLNLAQLKDIELKISTTYATRNSNTPPTGSQCVRADF